MAGPARADLFVGGVRHRTARVARLRVTDTGDGLESVLHSPETAAREDGLFRAFGCFFWYEFKRQGIDAMPRVFWGEAFAFEDMPQMGPAGGADDFRPVAVRIGAAEHGAGHGVVKGRPAASGVELVRRAVQRRATLFATVSSFSFKTVVFAGERRFGSFADDHALLLGSQFFFHSLPIRLGTRQHQYRLYD